MNLLDYIYNYLVIGPSGTGKTTFLASYGEKHHKKFKNPGYWITFPSIEERLSELLPNWIKTTTDLLDPGFAGASQNPKRKFVFGDEINRLISKYEHGTQEGRTFVDLISIHRHEAFDFLASDQVFDFLRGVRTRSHWLVFTGLNDTIYYALKENLSPRLMYWVEQFQEDLLDIGEENRNSIPEGQGQAVITNGINSFVLDFARPEWYVEEISSVWKMVSPEDLKRENREQATAYDFESDQHRSLTLAYHISKTIFNGKITKEKKSAAYITATNYISGEPLKLPDGGRGGPELIIATHALKCAWCEDKDGYSEALQYILDNGINKKMMKDPVITNLEKRVSELMGE